MIPLGPVVARSRVGVARAAAWAFLIDSDRRSEWWPELQLDPRVGGSVSERWSEGEGEAAVSRDASGTIDVWVEGHAIGFTWREAGDERDTAVLVTLRTQGRDTGITVTETGFDALPAAAERAAASQEGWQVLLRDLTTALEAARDAGEFGETPDDADAQGAASADASDGVAAETAAVELVEVEIEGEVDSDDAEESMDDTVAIELEAEPQVGDHPELETGPIAVIAEDDVPAREASGAEQPEDEAADDILTEIFGEDALEAEPDESLFSGDSAEGVETATEEVATTRASTTTEDQSNDERAAADEGTRGEGDAGSDSDPDEPDFDTLIRGN
ncbi:SRPBCC family protein [Leucobacter sp. USHLN153]|uniref:SRPBCC family protein n=1 Tax=Leucobacter sp. USHLN153 TaxID=3081268 RepID=UPI003019D5BF